MKRTALTKQAPHAWPFVHGTVVEGPARLVFLAGQVAFDRQGPDRQLVGAGDPAAQTRQAIENVRTLLRQAGGDLRDVVEMTVYATSADLMEPAGRVAQEYFADPLPAQSFIVVKALAQSSGKVVDLTHAWDSEFPTFDGKPGILYEWAVKFEESGYQMLAVQRCS